MRKAKYGSYAIGLWFVLLIVACHHQKEKIITLQEAEEKVFSLPLTQKINQYIDKFSHGKHGVSILSDSLLIDNKYFYELQIGYNSPIRYETYYTLYVNRSNEEDIRIMEPISGRLFLFLNGEKIHLLMKILQKRCQITYRVMSYLPK